MKRSEIVKGCNADRLGTFESECINALKRMTENVHVSKLKDQLFLKFLSFMNDIYLQSTVTVSYPN
jgi:hypothetical protein